MIWPAAAASASAPRTPWTPPPLPVGAVSANAAAVARANVATANFWMQDMSGISWHGMKTTGGALRPRSAWGVQENRWARAHEAGKTREIAKVGGHRRHRFVTAPGRRD